MFNGTDHAEINLSLNPVSPKLATSLHPLISLVKVGTGGCKMTIVTTATTITIIITIIITALKFTELDTVMDILPMRSWIKWGLE